MAKEKEKSNNQRRRYNFAFKYRKRNERSVSFYAMICYYFTCSSLMSEMELKPVHRRDFIYYAQAWYNFEYKIRKSALVVGDVC